MLRRSHSSVQQFEIKLEGNTGRNDDIVLLSGPPLEASASHFFGRLVLSTLDTTQVRKISIKLVGTLRLRWGDTVGSKNGLPPVKYEKQLYSQEFSDFEIPGKQVASNPASQRATPVSSLTNLTSYFGHKHKPSGGKSHSREPSPRMSRQSSSTSLINLAGPYMGSNGIGAKSSSHVHKLADNSSSGSSSNLAYSVPAGVHEFPFDLVIPGDISESVEGNRYGQLTYWLVATVERSRSQQPVVAKQHIRIVRTVGVDNYDVAHTVSINNTWPKKIEYKIDVPCRAVALGSQIEVQYAMIPLDKGLKLGRIRGEIVEYVSLATPMMPAREEENVVAQQIFEVPADFDHFADEWEFTRTMDMPRSLSRCSQDAFVEPYLKINHKFRCFISLINRDGHTSELRASLPITVYISPHIYILGTSTEEPSGHKHKHTVSSEQPIFNVDRQARPGPSTPQTDGEAPPTYSHHVYDRLFSSVPTPTESPAQSGEATPNISFSRPGSPGVSMAGLDPSQQAQLQAGLRALALNRQNSSQNMAQLNRGNSGLNLKALSRVPSYEEALNESASCDATPRYPD